MFLEPPYALSRVSSPICVVPRSYALPLTPPYTSCLVARVPCPSPLLRVPLPIPSPLVLDSERTGTVNHVITIVQSPVSAMGVRLQEFYTIRLVYRLVLLDYHTIASFYSTVQKFESSTNSATIQYTGRR